MTEQTEMDNHRDTETARFQSYDEAVDWITGLISFGIRPGLGRMERMLDRLNHPERRLKFIHVAGTNGKGSTCAFLANVLRKAGYDVGMFTSPYMERFTSRIQYNGQDIPDEEVVRIANRLKPLYDELAASDLGAPTMFEVCTLLAIVYYATVSYPDYVVWETGMGGRLDCTNVVMPVVSVITNVGHDHTDVLGEDLTAIAGEKAGIIKPGVPVISAVSQPEAVAVLEEVSKANKAKLYLMNRDFAVSGTAVKEDQQKFAFTGPYRQLSDVEIGLNGLHQIDNAAVALMTLEVLRQFYALVVDDDVLLEGLAETRWPGRMELLQHHPRLLVDGAHNPEGAARLVETLQQVYSYRKLRLMLGLLETKNHSEYLEHILPIVDTIVITEPAFRKARSADSLEQSVQSWVQRTGRPLEVIKESDWKAALARLTSSTAEDDLAVVTGSLYLISDVRAWVLGGGESEKGW
ncbi:bifunctional folylpolyglutamate synthase/dihydrofolate synthase [Xylanibacillus composti]|uniref:Dihydrofolate synthase/folylpolyglutamate synthase n=1 Tax=Xylanibacillus composti TaxID=1572762 RepID=A0A8J4H3A7_9BACL|nr:folylpolyglutamate synthase/dihydrofolate synthase family protein [Xylanibacillus composti]GIQ70183.1 bifunctional folylpolyglutamate synthase/dihydrofolate synthase [Xylanibacillus composti]